jgi:putative PEP-CTERM system histidine kinase
VSAEGRFYDELERNGPRILELAGASEGGGPQGPDWLPDWLTEWRDAWLMVPLVHRERVSGFIVVCRTRASRRLDPEDEELLMTAVHHAASYLAADQTTRELAESRRFEEISRGVAFIAHDLRNLANELTLSLANAREHIQKPEFQRDLLLSMEDSVAGMQRLLDKLAKRKQEPFAPPGVDFAELVRSFLRGHETATPAVSLECEEEVSLLVACDPDQLISMTGHLVQNAVEAAGPSGNVCVRLARDGASSLFEVEDDGPGMAEAFVRERLNHPFHSSKRGGYGLGLFECRELARQAGGELSIDSEPGRGTLARLRLPLTPAPTEVGRRVEPDAGA